MAVDRGRDDGGEVDRLAPTEKSARPNAGELEQVGHQPLESAGLGLDHPAASAADVASSSSASA